MSAPVLDRQEVTKYYGDFKAVDAVSLSPGTGAYPRLSGAERRRSPHS
jgi:hypothetical protein